MLGTYQYHLPPLMDTDAVESSPVKRQLPSQAKSECCLSVGVDEVEGIRNDIYSPLRCSSALNLSIRTQTEVHRL